MPTTPWCQTFPERTRASRWSAEGIHQKVALGENLSLQLLALAVQGAQLQGQLFGAGLVLGEQELQGYLGAAHASGGVDPGGQGVAHRDGGEGLTVGPRFPNQSLQARTGRVGQGL